MMVYNKVHVPDESSKRYCVLLDAFKMVCDRVKGDAHVTKLMLMKAAELDNFAAEQLYISNRSALTNNTITTNNSAVDAISTREEVVPASFFPPVGARSSRSKRPSSEDINHAKRTKRSPGNCTV